jgi:hypothetical protein
MTCPVSILFAAEQVIDGFLAVADKTDRVLNAKMAKHAPDELDVFDAIFRTKYYAGRHPYSVWQIHPHCEPCFYFIDKW